MDQIKLNNGVDIPVLGFGVFRSKDVMKPQTQ